MLAASHHAIRDLLHHRGLLPGEVDIRYEAPTKQWTESLTRPTVTFFLFDIQENKEKRETNLRTSRGDGRAERRMPPRRIDLYYLVAAFATDPEDEHELLWRVLAVLMRYQQLPPEVLPEALHSLDQPMSTRLSDKDETSRLIELWNALGIPPHPALCYVVTIPLDLDIALQAPLVLTRTARYRTAAAAAPYATRIQIGGIVRDKQGRPLADITVRIANSTADGTKTDEQGQFVLRGVPSGSVELALMEKGKVEKRVEINVPADSYELVLEG